MAIQSVPSQAMIETEHNSPSPSGRGRGEGENNVNSGLSEIEMRPGGMEHGLQPVNLRL
jgi:hypothetical protein